MNEFSNTHIATKTAQNERNPTFQSIFFDEANAIPIRVPDYQRAYSWEETQISLFIQDLNKYQGGNMGYYFGHFITEYVEAQGEDSMAHWEVVDGQQRITTFVLFLMVCRTILPSDSHSLPLTLINRFATVSYDQESMRIIGCNLGSFLNAYKSFDYKNPPSDIQIIESLGLNNSFTRSQKRIVLALLQFNHAFQNEVLKKDRIEDYIAAIMMAHCSHHLTKSKSVAVNIFEMHNTRGVPLTTIEIVKAMLMKFVYDHGNTEKTSKVAQIQREFGEIYGMEEQLAARSFRGEMTMEQLLRLHLRVVDDGAKKTAESFRSPPANANAESIINYITSKLHFTEEHNAVQYALNLASEFKNSVRIASETLPAWDERDALVGDVLILERDLSCEFFLLICRQATRNCSNAIGCISSQTLQLWEKLLFTRDFHSSYYNLKAGRDDFPALFASLGSNESSVTVVLNNYLKDGFRPDRTKGLQSLVTAHLKNNRNTILNDAFNWWRAKMTYAIYKYEISVRPELRKVIKGGISVEHILPQSWNPEWIADHRDKEKLRDEIGKCINGIGNLLLITRSENTSLGNTHPADKIYERYREGGSYKEHDLNRVRWRRPEEWSKLIHERGEMILKFLLTTLVDDAEPTSTSQSVSDT